MREAQRQIRDIVDRLEHATNIAVALEKTQIPLELPRIEGVDLSVAYRAGSDEALVGGDFYDVFPLGRGRVALVVGDVCGKGLEAAAQVAMLRPMLRYALYSSDSVVDAVRQCNAILIDHKLLTDFCTAFIAVYDNALQTLEYMSCGHEPALLVRDWEPVRVELLMPTGPVLGVPIDAPMMSRIFPVDAGDSLLVYTDGLVECGPNHCQLLSVSRIILALRQKYRGCTADQLASLICTTLRPVHADFNDDVCLLVARLIAPTEKHHV